MKNKLIEKWVNIFENEEEFCSGELAENLGIYIFERIMDKHIIKGKSLKAFYLKIDNITGIYIDEKLDDGKKYEKVKELFFRIINQDLQFEYFY